MRYLLWCSCVGVALQLLKLLVSSLPEGVIQAREVLFRGRDQFDFIGGTSL